MVNSVIDRERPTKYRRPTCTARGYGCNLIGMEQPVVCRSPEVMGGTAVFYGTRVPVQTLLDYLEAGDTIDDFLEGFPSVTRSKSLLSSRKRRTG